MIGATLDNYKILNKLGAGGQGTVYRAIDQKLGRTVVLKVLPPELTVRAANLKRFEREARLASSLDHPNICTIFDMGDVGDVHFIVMQYVEGKNVRQLVGGRPLELKSALSIAIQTADALAAAHSRGIIHRDIKAGNVMVTSDGQVKVLDFGLAKLLDDESARDSGIHHTELTEIGIPYGTATYAAPEQARGDKVDKRADIFSTGVLVYEMLAGTWPFQGRTSVDVRHAVIYDEPRPVNEMRPDPVPERIQQILDRAMSKEPKDRYQRMEEFRDELKDVLRDIDAGRVEGMESTVRVAPRHLPSPSPVARAVRWLRSITGSDIPQPQPRSQSSKSRSQQTSGIHETPLTSIGDAEKKSVAILPFKNLSNDSEASFYEFSLADAVITELARLRSLVVRPSSVIVKYQGREVDPREAGLELNVSAVLAAGFLRAGSRIRVTAQLLDVQTGAILWSDRIDGDASDILNVQDAIVQHIVEGLRLELTPDEKNELAKPPTADPVASEEYLRGRDRMGRFIYHTIAHEDVAEAIEHFKRAVEIDPNFALAHSALGGCYVNRILKGMGEPGDHARAEEAFKRALSIDPKLLDARVHMVFIYLSRGEKQKARAEIERLRQEFPNDVGVHFVRGVLARLDGDYDRALRSFERMVRLNPAELVVASYNRARVFMYQRRYDDAMLELDQGAGMEPNHPLIKTFRATTLFRHGQPERAVEILKEVLDAHPEMYGVRPHLAMALSATGQHEEARAQLTERVKEVARSDHDIPYWLASAYAMEGMKEEAFEWLQVAIERGNENLPWFESNPIWDPYRDDPRFQQMMQGIRDRRRTRQ